ncbi:MAG TPA: choice-of-anchor tandem repeat GloVer-containing protein [Rhizomicrobium sp.]|jgi:uncharacterized repeat protein (TIGR03803 family)|nr:choice-of-anchor tandem repeat GloVer-containing protein [Rhizomicrobium sp.]
MHNSFGNNKLPTRKVLTGTVRRGLLVATALSALAASPAFASYTVKHAFAGPAGDGANTFTSIIKVGNIFYGTTTYGGTGPCPGGCGTLFQMTASGVETVLYNFQGGAADGAYPRGGLVLTKNTSGPVLYGTTTQGGSGPAANCPDFGSCGTVFQWQINTSAYSVSYNFQGVTDGANPFSTLALGNNGMLYGTTLEGGSTTCSTTYSSCGTVFSINSLSGNAETVIYKFQSGTDGANPFSLPLIAGGKIYGTTTEGGDQTCTTIPHGCGTVYELRPVGPNWVESVLYRFHGTTSNDGADSFSSLVKVGTSLWGTTFYGGANNEGMVFQLTKVGPSWNETNIYSFTGGTDGGHPSAGLTRSGTSLYGDTSSGGNAGCQYYYSFPGCGTIFKVTGTTLIPSVYSFNGVTDGGNPYDTLLKAGAFLYGTTYGGGTQPSGISAFGTIFKFQ